MTCSVLDHLGHLFLLVLEILLLLLLLVFLPLLRSHFLESIFLFLSLLAKLFFEFFRPLSIDLLGLCIRRLLPVLLALCTN